MTGRDDPLLASPYEPLSPRPARGGARPPDFFYITLFPLTFLIGDPVIITIFLIT